MDEYVFYAEAKKISGCDKTWLTKMAKKKRIRTRKLGFFREYNVADLRAYAEAKKNAGPGVRIHFNYKSGAKIASVRSGVRQTALPFAPSSTPKKPQNDQIKNTIRYFFDGVDANLLTPEQAFNYIRTSLKV